jgi:hypothetical protein
LHTAYWDGWQGGYKRPGIFIEVVKDIIAQRRGLYENRSKEWTAMFCGEPA